MISPVVPDELFLRETQVILPRPHPSSEEQTREIEELIEFTNMTTEKAFGASAGK